MFQVNDVIVYGTQGVCKITGTEEKKVGRKKITYFVLKPVGDRGSTIFAPMDNELVLGKMRRLMTKDEIHKLIDSMPGENAVWWKTKMCAGNFIKISWQKAIIWS